jgi:mono/diheme cytochrome c family protein
LAVLLASPALAGEQSVQLKPGTGMAVTAANCAVCHSLDYIQMNAPFLSADGWKAEVAKMRGPFGAPIDQPTAERIVDYLVRSYAATPKP